MQDSLFCGMHKASVVVYVCVCLYAWEKKKCYAITDKEKMSCVMALYNNYIIYRMQV